MIWKLMEIGHGNILLSPQLLQTGLQMSPILLEHVLLSESLRLLGLQSMVVVMILRWIISFSMPSVKPKIKHCNVFLQCLPCTRRHNFVVKCQLKWLQYCTNTHLMVAWLSLLSQIKQFWTFHFSLEILGCFLQLARFLLLLGAENTLWSSKVTFSTFYKVCFYLFLVLTMMAKLKKAIFKTWESYVSNICITSKWLYEVV